MRLKKVLILVTILLILTGLKLQGEETKITMNAKQNEIATLGGGCFWCIEAVYDKIEGVEKVVSGYSGGNKPDPTYSEVCSGETGHAEVCQIYFDPLKITYGEILDIFWQAHDPTTINRQGGDIGNQYRSVILYHNLSQKEIGEKSFQLAGKKFESPLVTEILPLEIFYKAEEHHQDYFAKNPNQPYCALVIQPKLDKLKGLIK